MSRRRWFESDGALSPVLPWRVWVGGTELHGEGAMPSLVIRAEDVDRVLSASPLVSDVVASVRVRMQADVAELAAIGLPEPYEMMGVRVSATVTDEQAREMIRVHMPAVRGMFGL